MELVKGWNNEHRAIMAEAFSSSSAQLFLENLRINRPDLGGKTNESAAAASNEAKGWEGCIKCMADILGMDMNESNTDALESFNPNAETSRVVRS